MIPKKIKELLFVGFCSLLLIPSQSYAAQIGPSTDATDRSNYIRVASISFGPVDFVDENVKKLDEKVRKYLEEQKPDTFVFQEGCNTPSIGNTIVKTATAGGTIIVGTDGGANAEIFSVDLVNCKVNNQVTLPETNLQDLLITRSDSVIALTQNQSKLFEMGMDLSGSPEELFDQPPGALSQFQIVAEDTSGGLYVGGEKLRALNPTGSQRWVRGGDTGPITDLFITADSSIYYLDQNPQEPKKYGYQVASFNSNGDTNFFNQGRVISPDPGSNEKSFATMVPGSDRYYVRYEEKVREQYAPVNGDPSLCGPSFPCNGAFFIRQDVIQAFDMNGNFQWGEDYRDRTGVFHLTTSLIGKNTNLVAYDTAGLVWSIDATSLNKGQIWWNSKTTLDRTIPGIIGDDSTIYLAGIGTGGNNPIVSVNSASQKPRKIFSSTGTWDDPEPVALHRGDLVVVHDNNQITVVSGVSSFQPADTPWPVKGGNNRRSKLID